MGVNVLVRSACLAGAVALTITACSSPEPPSSSLPDFSDIAREAGPSVVNIATVSRGNGDAESGELPFGLEDSPFGDWFRDRFGDEDGGRPSRSLGSGFVLWDDYVLTNHHVVRNADEIIVRLADRRELEAELVGSDERSDLALLKLDADDLQPVRIGNSEALEVGNWVVAIGSPFGFEQTVTAGIVSAKGRSLSSGQYVPFIQTDVAINQGNSGGPLFNLDGEVVGINSQIYSQTGGFQGISFAIPIDMAINVAEQLRDEGSVARGWLGVVIQEVTRDLAMSFGLDRPRGALVTRVLPDGPAADAGLREGDVILRFDGEAVPRSAALPALVGATKPGSEAEVELLRDGDRLSLEVTVGRLEESAVRDEAAPKPAPPVDAGVLGMRVEPLGDAEREDAGVMGGGVRVLEVRDGPAAAAGIRRNDIILSVAGSEVDSASRLRELVERQTPGASVPFLVQRDGSPLFIAVRIPE
jgi:serine protease Do